MQKDERSERALLVTTEVIHLNPANYTTWYYRRLILVDLQKDLNEELEFTAEVAEDHPKNYQIWYVCHVHGVPSGVSIVPVSLPVPKFSMNQR